MTRINKIVASENKISGLGGLILALCDIKQTGFIGMVMNLSHGSRLTKDLIFLLSSNKCQSLPYQQRRDVEIRSKGFS